MAVPSLAILDPPEEVLNRISCRIRRDSSGTFEAIDRLAGELLSPSWIWVYVGDRWITDIMQLFRNHQLVHRHWLTCQRLLADGGKRHLVCFCRQSSVQQRVEEGVITGPQVNLGIDDAFLSRHQEGNELPDAVLRRILLACTRHGDTYRVISSYRMAQPVELGRLAEEFYWLWRSPSSQGQLTAELA